MFLVNSDNDRDKDKKVKDKSDKDRDMFDAPLTETWTIFLILYSTPSWLSWSWCTFGWAYVYI